MLGVEPEFRQRHWCRIVGTDSIYYNTFSISVVKGNSGRSKTEAYEESSDVVTIENQN